MKFLPLSLAAASLLLTPLSVPARGVTPYLPLNLAPDIERQVERVLILGGKSVMRRPIPAALVLEALPDACRIDRVLCAEVRALLGLYIRDRGVTRLQLNGGLAAGDSDRPLSNAHGRLVDSTWQAVASAFYQPNDYLLVSVGGMAYDGRATPTGTALSAGFDFAQLDIGYRDHWFSPLARSSLLVGTEAPTLPSVTLSNYEPITRMGFTYEVFTAQLSRQENIRYFDTVTSGRPRLTGVQAGIAPGGGYSLTLNRVMQYGGGARGGGSLSDLWEALTDREAANRPDGDETQEFGNQIASLAASIVVPGTVPFAVRLEYAGEDSSYGGNHRFGDTAISLGFELPLLWERFDAGIELSEWQNAWYVHGLYPEGLTHKGFVLGHWFGDQRQFGDRVGGWSAEVHAGYRTDAGNYWRTKYRTLDFVTSLGFQTQPEFPYRPLHEASLQYSSRWRGFPVSAELTAGRDALGESFGRLTGTVDFAMNRGMQVDDSVVRPAGRQGTSLYVNVGAAHSRVHRILSGPVPDSWTDGRAGLYLGAGVRREVSRNGELGIGLEVDDVDGQLMLSLRALDYRYRVGSRLAFSGFLGVGRYDEGAPAHGWYVGAGIQWRDILPQWDLALDGRYYDKLSRNRVAPGDPVAVIDRPRIHFDVEALTLYLSRQF